MNSTTAVAVATDEVINENVKYISSMFILICSPFAIVFNIFVLYLAAKFINFKVRLEQIFVVNMTLSDLLFGIVYLTTITINPYFPRWLCRPYFAAAWTTSIASVMFLLLLNIHKLVTLFFPLKAMMFMSRRKIIAQVVVCWLIWILLSAIFVNRPTFKLVAVPNHTEITCFVHVDHGFYIGMIILAYIIPLTMSLIISICIFGLVQKKGRRSNSTSKERRRLFKRILFVFVSTFWTALTSLPYRLIMFKVQLCRYYEKYIWSTSIDKDQTLVTSTGIETYLINNNDNYYDYDNYTATSYVTALGYNTTIITPTVNKVSEKDVCTQGTMVIIIQVFLCITSLGCVVNPLITIFTQSKYVKGTQTVWRSIRRCCRERKKSEYISGQLMSRNNTSKKAKCTAAEVTENTDMHEC